MLQQRVYIAKQALQVLGEKGYLNRIETKGA
jgi:hypothetical protein